MKKSIIFFCCLWTVSVFASEGRLYDIAEKDAIEEIKERAASIDWQNHFSREEKEEAFKRFKPSNVKSLPETTTPNTYLVDMTYTLDVDIPDGKGGILYPKGYRFNPLDFMNFRSVIVVIDGTKQHHIEWFKKSDLKENINVKLLISNGSYYDVSHQLNRPVFYALKEIVTRFNLTHVPCIVSQVDKMIQVKEIAVENL